MPKLNKEETGKVDQYFDDLNAIVSDPAFGAFQSSEAFKLLGRSVLAYASNAMNKYTQRTGSTDMRVHLYFILALGIWLGRRGVLRDNK